MSRPTLYDFDKSKGEEGEYVKGYTVERTQWYLDHYQQMGDLIPSQAGLACVLDISRETIIQWMKDPEKKEFSYIVGKMSAFQEKQLLSGGLSGDFNASITKLILTKHNYSDKTETDVNAKIYDFTHMTDEDLERELGE
jgi:hypothetical protein